ncbi:hypothetical protein ACET3Z_005532 [Daucus carota]
MTVATNNKLISVHPQDIKFQFELEKQCHCDLKLGNSTDQHVAFKVKTTSPKKYFVRPNTGIIQPWDSCVITVTLQPQRESPPDMQCKDKFLLQSTEVASHTDIDELPQDTFNKESGRTIEELKLRVVYVLPQSDSANTDVGSRQITDTSAVLQHVRSERDAAVQQTQQLQRELELLRQRRNRKTESGFSLRFALLVVLIGIMVGFFLNLSPSTPSTPTN